MKNTNHTKPAQGTGKQGGSHSPSAPAPPLGGLLRYALGLHEWLPAGMERELPGARDK